MRKLVVLLSVVALHGCKTDKPAPAPASKVGSGSGSAGKMPIADELGLGSSSGSGAGSGARPVNITLPKGPGTPPNKTAKALGKPEFEKLSKLEFPGFTSVVRNTDNQLDVRHSTPRPKLATTVTIAPCFDCLPMELARWKAKEAGLKMLLADELRDRPETIWEMGQTELNGQPLIFTYQFGHLFGKDENDNPQGAFSNAYALYYSDGKNQIRVVAEYKDDPVSREDLKALAPREDLEKLARAFLDAYTHAW